MKPLILLFAAVLVILGLLSCGSGPADPAAPNDTGGGTPAVKKTQPPKTPPNAREEETGEYTEDEYTEEESTGDEYAEGESSGEPGYEVEGEDADVPASNLIRSVEIAPRPLHPEDDIKIKVKTAAPLKENQELKYKFWKNRNAMEETDQPTLPADTCKKNDVIFADVTLYQDGEIAARKRTAMAPILNSPPVIEEVTMPEITGPGTYEFKVKAKDTDNDQITFSLELGEGSEDLGAEIDPATGNVTCTLAENPPEALKFTIIADDGDGGVTKKIVAMRFFKHPTKEK
jgi:hypothetical protein